MELVLILVLAGGLAHLWVKNGALESRLESQIEYFEDQLESLRYQLAQFMRHMPASSEASSPPVKPVQTPNTVEKMAEAAPAQRAVPAARIDPAPVEKSPAVEPEFTAEPRDEQEAAAPSELKNAFAIPRVSFDFEDIFGRLLPIWAGGITLAVAGFFLVKYSIEQGLLGPQVRVALGFLFGGALLGGAELAYRQEHRISDPRVRQALAGAGLATLYASFYLAGSMYGLVGSTAAFIGLAGVTGVAILLSFRFGLPSAILGLVGGFAAPLLVGSDDANLPLLALYLALVTGGLTYAGNRQGRSWLALAALAGGLGWGALILISDLTGSSDLLAFGGYIVVVGAVIPAFTSGRDAAPWLRIGAAVLAALQMAIMVEPAGHSLLSWGLYGLLASVLAFFGWRDERLRPASAFAAALAIIMLALWWDAQWQELAIVGIGLTAIFAAIPLANIWRGAHRKLDAYQLSGFVLAMMSLIWAYFTDDLGTNAIALVSLALSLIPALAAFLLWPKTDEPVPHLGIVTLISAVTGVIAAGLIATLLWAAPLVVGTVASGLVALAWQRDDRALMAAIWAFMMAAVLALLAGPPAIVNNELQRLGDAASAEFLWTSVLRWLAAMAPFALFTVRRRLPVLTDIAEVATVLLAYGVIAQFALSDTLAWIAAVGAAGLAFAAPIRLAARGTAVALAVLWAMQPLALWTAHGLFALGSQPMLIANDIGLKTIALQLIPALAAAATLLWKQPKSNAVVTWLVGGLTLAIAVVAAHMLFKQVFHIDTLARFAALGLAERTVWQALLLAGAVGAAKYGRGKPWTGPVSLILTSSAALHFAIFTAGWHNPLWSAQQVGPWPIINLLIPAYGTGMAAVWWLGKQERVRLIVPQWAIDGGMMALISLLALSELRQIFAGTVLAGTPVQQSEDLLRSLLGIILAIGFLLWGARAHSRSWRIGSLILMLGAVLKVFLFDANGLEGLIRVASFVALGFSLIGIGWFYARQLSNSASLGDRPS